MEWLFIALIYIPDSTTLQVSHKAATARECNDIGIAYKSIEEYTDYKCIEIKSVKW
jgi:hypothetical protein